MSSKNHYGEKFKTISYMRGNVAQKQIAAVEMK